MSQRTTISPAQDTFSLVERARLHATQAGQMLAQFDAPACYSRDLIGARHLLVAASEDLGAAAVDSALPTGVANALVECWASLDALLLAAGDLDDDTVASHAQRFLTRAAASLVASLPSTQALR
jgi:hypothetical protein